MTSAAPAPARTWLGPAALLAVLAYVPALATAPGVVAADTKQYLYLDPGRFLRGAVSLWDPDLLGGWVTHQTVGYLWPMGPFHWVLHTLGVPTWVAQRLWLGTLLVLAGTGVWWCCRLLGLRRSGATTAAALYQLSPYVLLYAPRTSVLLLPWAGLGWLLGLTVLAARRGGWRYPAAAALVVATMAGTNATAVVLVGLAPVLWLAWASWGTREVTWRRAAGAAARIGVLSLGTCAAWVAAIVVQARYGADVLAYSETVEAVSSTSLGSEVLRGLGYWLFYGGDVTGPWNSASGPYLTAPLLLALGLGLAVVGVTAAVAVRWAGRGFVALLLLVGTVVSVGAHPIADPTLYGRLLSGSSRSTLVLALRSSTRALPLVVLGLALAVGAAVAALGLRLPSVAALASVVVVVLAALNLPALWNGTYVDGLQRRPEELPAWWADVGDRVATLQPGTRLLELPGAEFAAYRWGTTNDPVLPGLTDRPTLTRELLPLGSPALMDLLLALDDRFQTGTVEGPELAPVARLLGAGALVVRGDTAFERYRTPRPEPTEALYRSQPDGLGAPEALGEPSVAVAAVAGLDEQALADPSVGSAVSPLLVVPVEDPVAVVRAEPAGAPVVLAGDGEGVVAAAAAGLVDGRRPVRYSASEPGVVAESLTQPGATLVVTDTNRLRARQWRGSQDTTGFTEDAGTGVLRADEADARLPVFPQEPAGSRTVADQRGGVTVRATAYGEPNAYRPEDRPARALDGDVTTAWRVGDRGEVVGERLRVDLDEPADLDRMTLVQPQDAAANRWITEAVVRTPEGSARLALDDRSRTAGGQELVLPPGVAGVVPWVEVEVAATNVGRRASYAGVGPVGIAELGLAGRQVDEVVVLPTDLLAAAGPAALDHDLAVVLTRQRHDPLDRWRDDDERSMVRELALPDGRGFTLDGTARLSGRATDAVLAALVAPGPVGASASTRLAGAPAAWGRAAVDGDPATAWTTGFGQAEGATLTVDLGAPATIDHLDLQVVRDGDHSVATRLVVRGDGGEERVVDLPALPQHEPGEAPPVVPVSIEPLTTQRLEVTVAGVAPLTTVDRRYGDVVTAPVAVAELGLPVTAPTLPAGFDTGCRDDLLEVDATPVPVRVRGATADLLARRPLPVTACGGALALNAGTHLLRSAPGVVTGIDLDRLVLRSAAGGGPATATPAAGAGATAGDEPAPVLTVEHQGRTSLSGTVSGDEPFWLVLGQGHNEGWTARVGGRDLGPPQVVDGGMNGWLVQPTGDEVLAFTLTWEPQRWMVVAYAVALLSVVACLVLVLLPRRRPGPPVVAPASFVGMRGHGPPVGWARALAATAALALVTLVLLPPWTALVAVPATLVALRVPVLRRVPAIGAVTVAGLVLAFYVVRQVVSQPAPGFGWPSAFERAHAPALLAVALVAADALVAAISRPEAVHYPAPEPTSPEPA